MDLCRREVRERDGRYRIRPCKLTSYTDMEREFRKGNKVVEKRAKVSGCRTIFDKLVSYVLPGGR